MSGLETLLRESLLPTDARLGGGGGGLEDGRDDSLFCFRLASPSAPFFLPSGEGTLMTVTKVLVSPSSRSRFSLVLLPADPLDSLKRMSSRRSSRKRWAASPLPTDG